MNNSFSIFTNVIIFTLLFIIFIYVYKTKEKKYTENPKIINFVGSDEYTFREMTTYINNNFKNVYLINGRVLSISTNKNITPSEKTVYIPYISPNEINTQISSKPLINQYNSMINRNKDFVFLANDNVDVIWNTDKIKRDVNKDFLIDNENEVDGKHNTHLIFTNYLYKNNKAVHVNYLVKKKGITQNGIDSFVQFLNYFSNYVINNKILFFSISGNVNVLSNKLKNIVRIIFKDSCYLSPGIEKKFITDIDDKHGARMCQFTIVSKTLAPYGVYFYLTRQRVEYFSNTNILVCEILSSSSNKKKAYNDDTENIYENFLKEKKNNTALKMDLERDEDFDMRKINFKQTGVYDRYQKTMPKIVYK